MECSEIYTEGEKILKQRKSIYIYILTVNMKMET